jgi:hypothetical protein
MGCNPNFLFMAFQYFNGEHDKARG